jgi:hypothetical protein
MAAGGIGRTGVHSLRLYFKVKPLIFHSVSLVNRSMKASAWALVTRGVPKKSVDVHPACFEQATFAPEAATNEELIIYQLCA